VLGRHYGITVCGDLAASLLAAGAKPQVGWWSLWLIPVSIGCFQEGNMKKRHYPKRKFRLNRRLLEHLALRGWMAQPTHCCPYCGKRHLDGLEYRQKLAG
jgi:hypothetical protein